MKGGAPVPVAVIVVATPWHMLKSFGVTLTVGIVTFNVLLLIAVHPRAVVSVQV